MGGTSDNNSEHDMSTMETQKPAKQESAMKYGAGMDMSSVEKPKTTMNHSMMGHDMSTMNSNQKKEIPITKLEESTGVQVDAVAMNPQYRLDDPGVGLRDNGRRVLTLRRFKIINSYN